MIGLFDLWAEYALLNALAERALALRKGRTKVKRTIARYALRDGSLPLPPAPAFAVLVDGNPKLNLTIHELEDLALEALTRREDDEEARRRAEAAEPTARPNFANEPNFSGTPER